MMKVRIPASTSNLGSGFDVFGLALRLYLNVSIEPQPTGIQDMHFTGEGKEIVTASKTSNFITESLHQVFADRRLAVPGYRISVHNEIPVLRGLGSSGTAVLAGVIAANYLGKLEMTDNEILAEAVHIEKHPDNICPSYAGGLTAAVRLEDGSVLYRKWKFPTELMLVFVVPEFFISTKRAREVLPKSYPLKDIVFNLQRVSLLFEALYSGNYSLLKIVVEDRLHQPYRAPLIPGMGKILALNDGSLAYGIFLSGSGPTTCAITHPENAEIAGKKIADVFASEHINARIMPIKVDNIGVRISNK
jgi:homoserine kinase